MQADLWDAGNNAKEDVLDTRLSGRRDGNGVAVAAQAGGDPEDVEFANGGHSLSPTVQQIRGN